MKHQNIYNRLRRIEGQVRGIEEMVSKDRPEPEIIIQLEAAKSSLSSTISSLIERMVEIGEDGKVTLSQTEIIAILRSVKKS
jgi:DNA-binding FrmR family transcriptional regulator